MSHLTISTTFVASGVPGIQSPPRRERDAQLVTVMKYGQAFHAEWTRPIFPFQQQPQQQRSSPPKPHQKGGQPASPHLKKTVVRSQSLPPLQSYLGGTVILGEGGSITGSTILRLGLDCNAKDSKFPPITSGTAGSRPISRLASMVAPGAPLSTGGRYTPRTLDSLTDSGISDSLASSTDGPSDKVVAPPAVDLQIDPAIEAMERKAGDGINASALSMAAPRKWSEILDAAAVVANRARRGSAAVTEIEIARVGLTPHDVNAPPCPEEVAGKAFSYMKELPWFHNLSNTDLQHIIAKGRVVYYDRGANIMREGSRGTGFYIVLHGSVLAYSLRRKFAVTMVQVTVLRDTNSRLLTLPPHRLALIFTPPYHS